MTVVAARLYALKRRCASRCLSYVQFSEWHSHGASFGLWPPPVVTPELVARGRALFTGGIPFANGGAPCAGCHGFGVAAVPGGNLAADLSARTEAAGERGFRGMLKNPNFPVMRKIYADKPLTEEEITALVAFSKDAVARKATPAGMYYPATGVGVFVCLIVGLTLYKRRVR